MASTNTLVCAQEGLELGSNIVEIMKAKRSEAQLRESFNPTVRVVDSPDEANCVVINDHIICRSSEEFPTITRAYEDLTKNIIQVSHALTLAIYFK